MDDQDFDDDLDCDQVEEYHKRPEVIEKARLRQIQLKQQKAMLQTTIDSASFF
jgi:hypothetical protein